MTMENNQSLKQRLVGGAVLISLVVVFLPMLVERGPAPTAERPAVPAKTEWRMEVRPVDDYPPSLLPNRPPVQETEVVVAAPPVDGADGVDGQDAPPLDTDPVEPPVADRPPPADLTEVTVKKGDTLYGIFRREGIALGEVRELLKVPAAGEKFNHLRPGQQLRFRIDSDKRIRALEYRYSGGPPLRLQRIGGRLQLADSAARLGDDADQAAAAPVPQAKAPEPSRAPAQRPTQDKGPVAWGVQVGFYSDIEVVRGLQARLRAKGYGAYLTNAVQTGEKGWILRVGPEVKKSGAIAMAREVGRLTGTDTQVVSYP